MVKPGLVGNTVYQAGMAILVAALLALSGCGTHRGSQQMLESGAPDAVLLVDSLPLPEGVSGPLWDELRATLATEMERFGSLRRAASAPVNEINKVPDFAAELDGGSVQFNWSYRNTGDYDLNGEVNVSDLTQIVLNFQAQAGDANWDQALVADGDYNGEVNISDITPIAANYQSTVTGYLLEAGTDPDGPLWPDISELPLSEAVAGAGGFPRFEYILSSPAERSWYRVRPYYDAGAGRSYGVPSDPVQIVLDNETPPDTPGQLVATDAEFLDRVVLSWVGPANADGYRIYRDSQLIWLAETSSALIWEDTTLTDTRLHTYWVSAFNQHGASGLSQPDEGSMKFTGGGAGRGDWSMYRHDRQRTGRSPYTVPDNPALLWAYEIDGAPTAPVFGDDGAVFFASGDGKVYAINPDATTRWVTDLGHTTSSDVSISEDGTIYVGRDSYYYEDGQMLFALDSNGTILWGFEADEEPGEVYGSPLVGPDGTIYFGETLGRLYRLDPNGIVLNQFGETKIAFQHFFGSAAMGPAGTIYMGRGDGRLYALDSELEVEWAFGATGFINGTPAVGPDGTIYFGDFEGEIFAVNPDGSKRWQFTVGWGYAGVPAIGEDGTVYFGSRNSPLYAFSPDGEMQWSFGEEDMNGGLAIDATGTIFASDIGDVFYAINPDGTEKWSYPHHFRSAETPAIDSNGRLYVGISNKLYCFGEGEMPPAPVAPQNVQASDAEFPEFVEVTWEKVPNATHYRIYRDNHDHEGGDGRGPHATVKDVDRWLDGRLLSYDDWKDHTYWVVAANPYGDSDLSEPDVGSLGRLPADPGPGDWNMAGREPKRQRRSPAIGPPPDNFKWAKSIRAEWATLSFCEPVIGSNGRVYLSTQTGWLVVFNPDGTYHWKLDMDMNAPGNLALGVNGEIFAGSIEGKIKRFDRSGNLIWTYDNGHDVYNGHDCRFGMSPILGNGETLIVSCEHGILFSIGLDGQLKWQFETGGGQIGMTAVDDEGTIYFGAENDYLYALNQDGSERWRFGPIYSPPAVVIGNNGELYTRDPSGLSAMLPNGQVAWSVELSSASPGTPAIGNDGTIYVSGVWGEMVAYSPDGTLLWNYEAIGNVSSPVVDAEGTIYFLAGKTNHTYALNSDGSEKWVIDSTYEYIAPGTVSLGVDGTMYFLRGYQYLSAYGPEED